MTTPQEAGSPLLDFRDRQYVSRYALDTLGLGVGVAGDPADPDDEMVQAVLVREDTGARVFERVATRQAVGLYEVGLTSDDTSAPGNYTVQWVYSINGLPQTYDTFIVVGEAAPDYDRLEAAMKAVVDGVWVRFADLYDSPLGGPNLMTYFQSHFSRNRVAQLLRVAVGLLDTTAQPYQGYSTDNFPVQRWGSLLESALYVEVLKHLRRSYVEQPAFVGGNVSRLDRRDYMQRWGEVLRDEQATLKSQLDVFKISNMGLGRAKVLVSGGVFGRFGPTRFAGSVAARPRYWTRFY